MEKIVHVPSPSTILPYRTTVQHCMGEGRNLKSVSTVYELISMIVVSHHGHPKFIPVILYSSLLYGSKNVLSFISTFFSMFG